MLRGEVGIVAGLERVKHALGRQPVGEGHGPAAAVEHGQFELAPLGGLLGLADEELGHAGRAEHGPARRPLPTPVLDLEALLHGRAGHASRPGDRACAAVDRPAAPRPAGPAAGPPGPSAGGVSATSGPCRPANRGRSPPAPPATADAPPPPCRLGRKPAAILASAANRARPRRATAAAKAARGPPPPRHRAPHPCAVCHWPVRQKQWLGRRPAGHCVALRLAVAQRPSEGQCRERPAAVLRWPTTRCRASRRR